LRDLRKAEFRRDVGYELSWCHVEKTFTILNTVSSSTSHVFCFFLLQVVQDAYVMSHTNQTAGL